MALTTRRAFITSSLALIAAPAIVRMESLMPIKALAPDLTKDRLVQLWIDSLTEFSKAQADLMLYGNSAIKLDGLIYQHIPIQEFFNGQ